MDVECRCCGGFRDEVGIPRCQETSGESSPTFKYKPTTAKPVDWLLLQHVIIYLQYVHTNIEI
jgi:hypothetical protein